jgi:hypothetical protein
MNGVSSGVVEAEGRTMELTQIRGIGATKKQWLAALGIHTVEALAQIDVEELKTQLKDSGYTVSRTEIDAWVQQAQAIVPDSFPQESVSETAAQPPASTPTWTTISSFQIEFQSRSIDGVAEQQIFVQKLDDKVSHTWFYVNENELQNWILEHIQPELKQSFLLKDKFTRSATSSPVQDELFNIEISHVHVYQPARITAPITVDRTNPFITGTLVVDQPIAVELVIKRVDSEIARSTPLTLYASCQAKHLATGAITELGSTRMTIQPNSENLYTLRLPEVVLQQPGAYRLLAVASIDDRPTISASFKVPMLQLQSLAPTPYQISEFQMSCGI